MKQPCYLGLEDARQVLAEMGVNLSLRQMQRAAEQDAQVDKVLKELEVDGKPRLRVMNKIDLLLPKQRESLLDDANRVHVSAGWTLHNLRHDLGHRLPLFQARLSRCQL